MHDHKGPQLIQIAPLEPDVSALQKPVRPQHSPVHGHDRTIK